MLQWRIFYLIAKDPNYGVKMRKNLVFFILATIYHIPEWIWFG